MLNPSVNLDENGNLLPREGQRVEAFFLHDVVLSHRRHARGTVAQMRGDAFDAQAALGNVCDASERPAILPPRLPSDTSSPAFERAQALAAKGVARAANLADRQRIADENETATREAMNEGVKASQANAERRGQALAQAAIEKDEARRKKPSPKK